MSLSISEKSNYTVAYLDIVGFKEILKKYPAAQIGKIFSDAIKGCERDVKHWIDTFDNQYKTCLFSIFSDSIVIFSPDDSIEGCRSVILHAQRIMQHLIVRQFPVRGAISFGEVFLRKDPFIFVGEGYMRAVALEGNQEWYGVAIDKSVEENFSIFFKKDRLMLEIKNNKNEKVMHYYSHPNIVRYSVPMKCGHNELLYTVNWLDRFSMLDENSDKRLSNASFLDNVKKILPLCSVNQDKYNNTLSYIEYIGLIMPVDDSGNTSHVLKNDVYI